MENRKIPSKNFLIEVGKIEKIIPTDNPVYKEKIFREQPQSVEDIIITIGSENFCGCNQHGSLRIWK